MCYGTGGQAEFLIAAKDAKGVRKSLGGDVFTVSWTTASRREAPMTGLVRYRWVLLALLRAG